MSSLHQLGRYRIEEDKGSRGEAHAYKAFDMVRKRTVLLLTLKPETAANHQRVGRILQNAQAVSELVHPRLGWVWETGSEDGMTYVAERFVNGPSLRERLDESGPLSWGEALQVVEQVAQGLDFLHTRGRVHGALRPENIILSSEVGGVLGGLGVPEAALTLADVETTPEAGNNAREDAAAGPDSEAQPTESAVPQKSRLPERFAAAPYTAPEIWMGEPPSPASDQYALACILVEMLSGAALFGGENVTEICERSLEGPTLPAVWPEDTPWQVEPALERALAQQPAERFASAGDFAAAPERLAARSTNNEEERRRREAQRQARLQAEAQARRQAEEAQRQAALERARREVEEQARREAEAQAAAAAMTATMNLPAEGAEMVGLAAPAETPVPEPRTRKLSPTPSAEATSPQAERQGAASRRLGWPAGAGIVVLLALAWLWGSGRLSGGAGATPTAAASPAATQPALAAPSATASDTPTIEPSVTSSETPAPSPTLTARPTRTATRTSTPTITLSPTATTRAIITRRPPPPRAPPAENPLAREYPKRGIAACLPYPKNFLEWGKIYP